MKPHFKLVPCTEPYWEFVRKLRIDPRVESGFIQKARITKKQQQSYMAKHWREHFICIVNDIPAGYIGSIDKDIRVCTHPDFQHKGAGVFMVNELMKLLPGSVAKIKSDNVSSKRLFEKCGFVPAYIIYEKGPKTSKLNRCDRKKPI